MKIISGPLQGHTEKIWRDMHRLVYGGPMHGTADEYYAPFSRCEKGSTRPRDIRDLSPRDTAQVIFRNVEEFNTVVADLHRNGAVRIDLNLGCPFPLQVRKGRGAALVANHDDVLLHIAAAMASRKDIEWSVKMRLGRKHPHEWALAIDAINAMPLKYVTIHPRTADQAYKGELHIKEFEQFMAQCRHPVVYNGDITSSADIDAVAAKWPRLYGVMVSRGLMARPSLIAEAYTGIEWTHSKRMLNLLSLHAGILQHYETTLCGDSQILMKIRPFWEYTEQELGHRQLKLIKKAVTLQKYKSLICAMEYNARKF